LVRRQNEIQPRLQLWQAPQATLNGADTRSPGLTQVTPGAISA